MSLVVTGISQNGNIKPLEEALSAAGLSLEPVQLIGPDDSDTHIAGGIAGADLISGGSGVGVPGITGGLGGNRGMTFFRNESLSDRLGDLEIPDSEVENYVEALQAGRSIVAYFAKAETLAQVQAIFSASDLVKVKTF